MKTITICDNIHFIQDVETGTIYASFFEPEDCYRFLTLAFVRQAAKKAGIKARGWTLSDSGLTAIQQA